MGEKNKTGKGKKRKLHLHALKSPCPPRLGAMGEKRLSKGDGGVTLRSIKDVADILRFETP